MNAYKKVLNFIERVEIFVCSALLIGIVLIGATDILMRFAFRSPMPWTLQLNVLLANWLYFLGFAVLANRGEYIFVEYFNQFFPPILNRILEIVVPLAILFFCVVVLYKGLELQPLQHRLLVSGFPVRRNFFSLPVVVCMASVILSTIYDLWQRIDRPANQDGLPPLGER